MAAALPRFMVLKSVYNNRYLSLTNGESEGLPAGCVKFEGHEVSSPRAKFEVVMAKYPENKKKGLVHIRCCYNNKYWVRNHSGREGNHWIVAGAENPEENKCNSSCTLFEAIVDSTSPLNVRFRHVQLGRISCLWRCGPPMEPSMYLGSERYDKDLCDLYTVMDWESVVVAALPRFVGLKSVYYDKYLMLANARGRPAEFLKFDARDKNSALAKFELVDARRPGNKGRLYHIKCCANANYNTKCTTNIGDPQWIVAAAEDTVEEKSNDSCTLFEWVTDCDCNGVQFRLRHVGSARFARVETAGPLVAGLRLGSDSPDDQDDRYLFTVV